jgi:glycosyltransferase 2 family protein
MNLLKLIGNLLSLISIIYLGRQLLGLNLSALSSIPWINVLIAISFGTLIYTLLTLAMAYPWKISLEQLSSHSLKLKTIISIYAKSNLAKYLPGNIFHFASRNLLAQKLGLTHPQVALASIWETGFTLGFSLIIFALYLLFNYVQLKTYISYLSLPLLSIIMMMIGVSIIISLKKTNIRNQFFSSFELLQFKKLFSLVPLYTGFNLLHFLLAASVIVVIFWQIGAPPGTFPILLTLVGASAVARFIGFLIPGLPGGIGVREAVTLVLLSPYYQPEIILLASIILRLVTIISDILTYFIGIYFSYESA